MLKRAYNMGSWSRTFLHRAALVAVFPLQVLAILALCAWAFVAQLIDLIKDTRNSWNNYL